MRKKIIVGKPYIKNNVVSKVNKNGVRLCSDVEMENPNTKVIEKRTLYYEFDIRFAQYLCAERSDAFVIGLITTAMENDMDIVFEAPISERLYYQLTTNYIPMISKFNPTRQKVINLIGSFTNLSIGNAGGIATGCSGGVDSFYTIVRHNSEHTVKEYQLTHLIFSSCGTQDVISERIEAYYNNYYPRMQELANLLGCDCIGCYTNIHEFYKYPYQGFSTFFATIYGSVAYAIQKLLTVYYINSGDPITEFTMDLDKAHGHDASIFDIFTVGCMNTENLTFYSSGIELTRMEKEKYISNDSNAQEFLTVCGIETSGYTVAQRGNCSNCTKCLRTMVQLYTINELDKFDRVFDLNDFYKHKSKRIGKMLAVNKRSYVIDTIKEAKKNGVKLGIKSYLWKDFFYKPIIFFSKLFNKNKLARKLYYKFNIDYKLHGYRNAKYEYYKDKI